MTQKLRIPLIFLLLSVLALGGLAFQVAAPFFQIDTPTPEGEVIQAEDSEALLEQSQAANSDGITFLGIVIFVIILVPLLVLRKEW
jgi:hypothetical protein